MNIKEMIIDLYLKGHSIQYITQCVYKRMNKSYFNDFHKNHVIKMEKYCYIEKCRNLVEKTILEYNTKDVVLYKTDTNRA